MQGVKHTPIPPRAALLWPDVQVSKSPFRALSSSSATQLRGLQGPLYVLPQTTLQGFISQLLLYNVNMFIGSGLSHK